MEQNLQTILDFIQQNKSLTADEKNTLSKAVKEVDKELTVTAFKLDRTEKVKRTTAILLEETIEELEQKRKAVEAQNRELEIEAALERVRGRSLAMHNTTDLSGVVFEMFTELVSLDAQLDRCLILIVNPKTLGITWYLTGKEGLLSNNGFLVQDNPHPSHQAYLEGWRKKRKKWHYLLAGEEKTSWDNFGFTQTGLAQLPDFIKANMAAVKSIHLNISSDDFGCLIASSLSPLSEAHANIVERFTLVFNQTYTRFLDLQKSEAQAREAQIEVALERVRSQSMGMHKSEELQKVVTLVFDQFHQFGIKISSTVIYIFEDNSSNFNMWTADGKGSYVRKIHKSYINHPIVSHVFETWSKGKNFLSDSYNKAETYDYMFKLVQLSDFQNVSDDRKKYLLSVPGYTRSVAFGKYIGIAIANYDDPQPFSEVENEILRRVAKVFEQAYVRFLDLQKAEAQAREAIKQASLDRVRGEIASMRTKDDLDRITPLVWKELIALGVAFIRCGVFIMDEGKRVIHTYLSTPDGKSLSAFEMNFDDQEFALQVVDHWYQKKIYHDFWDKKKFLNFMQNLLKTGRITTPESFQGASAPPESLYLNFVPFKHGMLYVGNTSALGDEEIKLVMSLADSFSIAYLRYEDFRLLEEAKTKIELTLKDLKSAQSQLIQSEKMASLGELTAGIAHEIQNPLNFVNNFSEISTELVDEMKEELEGGNWKVAIEIAADVIQNLKKINHHGKRAADIVKGMLQHSRTSSGQKEFTDINALADEYLRLAYHGFRAKDKSFNAGFKTCFDPNLPKINIIPQDIGRVLLNLINNAFYAVSALPSPDKSRQAAERGSKNFQTDYKPMVTVTTTFLNPSPAGGGREAVISVIDNGPGIPAYIVDKIFQPFFTTKPTGEGTGLGLSLSYDIVKAHDGQLKVETKEGEGTEFIIQLSCF